MPYTEFTFIALGRIAKSAGVVRRTHIDVAQRLMADLRLDARDRTLAIAWFDSGKTPEFDFAPLARACRETRNDRAVLNEMALESLCIMAWVEGPPDPPCRHELERLAVLLGIGTLQLRAAESRAVEHQRRQLPLDLRQAYQMLGVEHWVDDAELKLAYRRLMSRHHPDKLGTAAGVREAQHAGENSIAIRKAYDFIRETRRSV